MAHQYIGILLNTSTVNKLNTNKEKYENISYYEQAAKQHHLIPCFFHLRAIDLTTHTVTAYIKDEQTERYIKKQLPIPSIIHNRAMLLKKRSHHVVDALVSQGYIVFNKRTRYSKLKIHRLLMENNELLPYLPETARANVKNLRAFMKRHRSLIVKPSSGSVGLSILKLEKQADGWTFTYPKSKYGNRMGKVKFRKKLPKQLLQKIQQRTYLVQERIELATYNGSPFDLRVTVQRNMFGEWQVTGIAGKVAAKGKYVTNVAQGGQVVKLPELIAAEPSFELETITNNIVSLATLVAKQLSDHLPNLADLGLDIGLDSQGHPYFIECNCRDLRISFKKGNMLDTWESSYSNPIGYASFLIKQCEQQSVD